MTTLQGNCCGLQSEWSVWWHLAAIGQVPGGKVRWQLLRHSNIWKSNSSQTSSTEQARSDGLKKEVKRRVYNTEISDVFADLIEIHILLGFFQIYSFKMSHKTPQTISHFQRGRQQYTSSCLKNLWHYLSKAALSIHFTMHMARNSQKGSTPDFPDPEKQKLCWGMHQQL